jgi:hypothetical protein
VCRHDGGAPAEAGWVLAAAALVLALGPAGAAVDGEPLAALAEAYAAALAQGYRDPGTPFDPRGHKAPGSSFTRTNGMHAPTLGAVGCP